MADRINAIVVVLEHDIRIDDAALIISAIGQIRGVVGVKANIVDLEDHVAYTRAKLELSKRLHEATKGWL